MPGSGKRFQGALDGYAKFLRHRDSAPARQRPRLARRAREFLLFARGRGGVEAVGLGAPTLGAGEMAHAGGVQDAEGDGGPVRGGHDLAS